MLYSNVSSKIFYKSEFYQTELLFYLPLYVSTYTLEVDFL